ncbi:hypothetical protein G9C85_18520 [Halorubellus sp. JP-L1]|uniref:DUF5783 family protein n=1 Tax=Halorubellus sp. JP-L1 TaxID=2715753 RepID=UPI00140B0C99|nr:DUF5783 family protein [Halorubellus sp. JP-L1]NHN43618.1 hypothetical protein [Halorubellus sp. JP-L1]
MSDLDPETFEEEKYVEYFPKLQQAYKNAFNRVNERYDAELVHAIDQQVLNESEPHYEGDGEFTMALPDDPYDRLEGVIVDREKFEAVLDAYVDEIKTELRRVFSV